MLFWDGALKELFFSLLFVGLVHSIPLLSPFLSQQVDGDFSSKENKAM
jgi:hypothetical protein